MAFDAVRQRPQLSDEVAAHLREQIMTAAIRPGDFIRIDETAERLGVSATPVREALVTLRGQGMVELSPRRGYHVAELTRTDVEDVFWLQAEIAVRLALRAAATVTETDLEHLEVRRAALADAVDSGDGARVADAEFEFHRLLNQVATGGRLARLLHTASHHMPIQLYARDPGWGEVALDSHARLIEAFRSGDRDAIVVQTRRQFDDGAARLTRHLEDTGIWQSD